MPTSTTFGGILQSAALMARISELVDPKLEIAAVVDRACKSPAGGPALSKTPQVSTFLSPRIWNGSMERMCLALGVKTLDDLAAEFDELLTPQMPSGIRAGRPEDAADGGDAFAT